MMKQLKNTFLINQSHRIYAVKYKYLRYVLDLYYKFFLAWIFCAIPVESFYYSYFDEDYVKNLNLRFGPQDLLIH